MTDQAEPSFAEAPGPLQGLQKILTNTQKGKPINPR